MDALVYFNHNTLHFECLLCARQANSQIVVSSLHDKPLTQELVSPKTQRGFPKIKQEISDTANI